MSKNFTLWTKEDVQDLIEKSDIAPKPKELLLKALHENDANGKSLYTIKSSEDLEKSLNIPSLHAVKLFEKLEPYLQLSVDQSLIDKLLQENLKSIMEQKRKNTLSTSYVVSNQRKANGFLLNFQGKENKLETSKEYFLKTDTITFLKEHYIKNISGGGDIENLDMVYNGKHLDDKKKLGDYGIEVSTTILVTFRTRGGSSEYRDIKTKRYACFHNEKRIKPTLKSDSLIGYDSKNELRVEMPCGHVFSPLTMFQYIKMLAENIQATSLVCPILKCGEKWEFEVMSAAAGLNNDEISFYGGIFVTRMRKNDGSVKVCPNCQTLCQRPSDLTMFRVNCVQCKGLDFCWNCSKTWKSGGMTICGNDDCTTKNINQILNSCKLITPSFLKNVKIPEIRACPRCLTIVTYMSDCKHMQCWSCKKKFCFVCLGLELAPEKWPCNSSNYECKPHPVQVLK